MSKQLHAIISVLFLVFFSIHPSFSQDPLRFKSEIDSLSKLNIDAEPGNKILLFTGSSSIRMWKDVQAYFPEYYTINTGFGGSQMSDLFYFLHEVVLQYSPDQVFIYEGDNDVSNGKKPGKIIKDYKIVIEAIHKSLPGIMVNLISPKPSLARWELRHEYGKLNNRIRKLAAQNDRVIFIDVWPVMLDSNGYPVEDLFLEDGLHMTPAGYKLWAGEIKNHLIK